MATVKVLDWRPMPRNTLRGFAKLEFPSGMVISDVVILQSERGPWASPPSKPMISRDGSAMKDDAGKIRYVPVIEFVDRATRERWSDAVITALRESHPEALP